MAAAPASPIKLIPSLHEHKPPTQQPQRKNMTSPRVIGRATLQPHTYSRAHNLLQFLQLKHVDQACTNSRRTRITDTVVVQAA
jgi:hypothetical protein